MTCEWCGKSGLYWDALRLVYHRGKKETWCNECVAEDAVGNVSSLKSILERKRKMERPKFQDS